jgi:hypothetical protein
MTPRELADSLTPAQKLALPAIHKNGYSLWPRVRISTHPLERRKLITYQDHDVGFVLTRLGLKVRDILEEENANELD